jgi:hypothetical protein
LDQFGLDREERGRLNHRILVLRPSLVP